MLHRQGHSVTLATVWENNTERQWLVNLEAEGIMVIARHLTLAQMGLNLVFAFLSGKPLQSTYSWKPGLANQIARLLISNHPFYDIIQIEHLRGAAYGLRLKAKVDGVKPRTPIVWDSVDNITSLFEQAAQRSASLFGRWATWFELARTRGYERYLAEQFDRILVTSPNDRAAFTELCPEETLRSPIEVLTNGVDLDYFAPSEEPRSPDTIVFSGKLSYHANITAAVYLVEKVMPWVWASQPEVKVQLVGKDPTTALLSLAQSDGRIQVTGTVPDLREYLRRASMSAAPITYGAGVQNKVLEAMACATPVVATSKAVSALRTVPGQDLLVADEPQDLAEAILYLLGNEDRRNNIGRCGRNYVQQNHDWNVIAKQLVSIYEDIFQGNHERNQAG